MTQDSSAARWVTEQLQQLILTSLALLLEENAYALQLWNAAVWLLMTRCALSPTQGHMHAGGGQCGFHSPQQSCMSLTLLT